MKRMSLIVALACASAAAAQDSAPPDDPSEGWTLLREGSRLLLQNLFDELEPALKDLEGFVMDLNSYEAPVILPNGDILIRRKPDAPVPDGLPGVPDNALPERSGDGIDL